MPRVGLLEAYEFKSAAASRIGSLLDEGERQAAGSDPHARRLPRPCGLTVHTGVGCGFGCVYCYVPDMGFPVRPRPYPLSGLQLAYAVALNPSVAVGEGGTLLAFGSVTEPFADETFGRSLEYLEAVSRLLGNPVQVSTKAFLDPERAGRVLDVVGRRLSALVTIISLKLAKALEPGAPPPEERFETIENLARHGAHVSLFLRPLIPGVAREEVREILAEALERGAGGVVAGSLRVTEGVLKRLKASGYPHLGEVLSRISEKVRGARQVVVRSSDLKRVVSEVAESLGARVYPAACAANMEAHGLSCAACGMGPCGDPSNLPGFDVEEVPQLGELYGVRVLRAESEGSSLRLWVGSRERVKPFTHFLKALIRRRVMVSKAL